MATKQFGLALSVFLCLACVAGAQRRRELRRVGSIPVPDERAGPIMGPLKCGYDGGIYIRVLTNPENLWLSPVVKILPDGKRTARFSLATVSGLEKAGILDFAPGAHGDLYLLTSIPSGKYEEPYIVTFDESGAFVSKTRLQSGLSPSQLAVFSSGEFLISGRERKETPRGLAYGKAFAGIFDSHGQLVKRLELSDDIEPNVLERSTEAEAAVADKDYGRAISLSTAESSNDGRVYLMRFAMEAPVFAITPTGEASPIRVEIPKGTYLNSLKVDGNKMVTMFIRKKDPQKAQIAEVILSVWDLDSGRKVDEFFGSIDFGTALVCYKGGVLTFVHTSDAGHLELLHASPGS